MATENQMLNALRGVGSRFGSSQVLPFTVAGDGTYSGVIAAPAGAWLSSIRIETPAAISGSPTSALVRVGSVLAGADIVADVNAQNQGHINATILPTVDVINGAPQVFYVQLVVAGGTSPAGTVNVRIDYAAPVV